MTNKKKLVRIIYSLLTFTAIVDPFNWGLAVTLPIALGAWAFSEAVVSFGKKYGTELYLVVIAAIITLAILLTPVPFTIGTEIIPTLGLRSLAILLLYTTEGFPYVYKENKVFQFVKGPIIVGLIGGLIIRAVLLI